MPTISRFNGVIIRMFYDDHMPPHFHAIYGEYELDVGISPVTILVGKAPTRIQSMVLKWAMLHQEELMENWERSKSNTPLVSIAPLR